jgi:hypothetical protein
MNCPEIFTSPRLLTIAFLLLGETGLKPARALAQEAGHETRAGEAHEGHRHAIFGIAGLATHTAEGDTGPAFGLGYAYELSPRWGVSVKTEYASSDLERDYILLVGGAFLPTERLEIIGMAGVEKASIEEEHEGEPIEETETEVLFRLGLGYQVPLSARFHLVPEFNVDLAAGRSTLVYGLVLAYAF